MRYLFPLVTCYLLTIGAFAQSGDRPGFEETLSLASISNPQLSPDGRSVLYERRTTDWVNNRYDTEVWLARDGQPPFQLTNHPTAGSSDPHWSPDGVWISFRAPDADGTTQLYVMRSAGGAAFAVTGSPEDVGSYAWAPGGARMAFLRAAPKSPTAKTRQEQYGDFAVEDAEYRQQELWVVDFSPAELYRQPLPEELRDSSYRERFAGRPLVADSTFSINGFEWSPDGSQIAFTHQPDPLRNSFFYADISVFDYRDSTCRTVVANPSYDGLLAWSPDGTQILYETHLSDSTANYYRNEKLYTVGVDGAEPRRLAAAFDENISDLMWTQRGIFGVALQRTESRPVRIDPATGATQWLPLEELRVYGLDMSASGERVALVAGTDDRLPEVFLADYPLAGVRPVTTENEQLADRRWPTSEVVSWISEDGTTIEGVLHKPRDFDPDRRYPLLVVIHGGPTGISVPEPAPSYVYPIVQWVNRGALVLRPNYRGSAGYGEEFRSLNVRNLGVGDAWDVLSGVQYLVDQGLAAPDSVGAMGWSQGGYISAFLATTSDRFQAISVGAGISNWMTYYVNTDIHPFTRQYLQATPWSDPEIYAKTSPMTTITQARTPTLIQHGEFDRRVPTANAYELYQGLQDNDVPTKLIIYKGFGHGITKPKERLAATQHNWDWFERYLWGKK